MEGREEERGMGEKTKRKNYDLLHHYRAQVVDPNLNISKHSADIMALATVFLFSK